MTKLRIASILIVLSIQVVIATQDSIHKATSVLRVFGLRHGSALTVSRELLLDTRLM